jgi:hypothetical protein
MSSPRTQAPMAGVQRSSVKKLGGALALAAA